MFLSVVLRVLLIRFLGDLEECLFFFVLVGVVFYEWCAFGFRVSS